MFGNITKKIIGGNVGVLERKVAVLIILFSTIIALLATSFQIWYEYNRDTNDVSKRFDTIQKSYLDSLANALWILDSEQAKIIAAGIYSLPNVAYLDVQWENGEQIVALGSPINQNQLSKTFVLEYRDSEEIVKVGSIFVTLTLSGVLDRTFSRFYVLLATNGVKTFIVIWFILSILHRLVTKHLNRIAEHVDIRDMNQVLNLEKSKNRPDELDKVAEAINSMRRDLKSYIENIVNHKSILEKAVAEKTEELQKAFEEKATLLRVVCHDISNPLTVISGNIQLANASNITDEMKSERIKAVEKAAEMMRDMLNNVREMESISSGKKAISLVPVDLNKTFEMVKFIFEDRLKEKNLKLEILNEVPFETRCLADPVGLTNQVLNNLVSNAIKFSFDDSTIKISAKQIEDNIFISIKDSGIGMSEQHLAQIFDSNEQTTRTGTHGESGTGFGMPLVKKYVEKFGGHIDVDSISSEIDPERHGSSFHIYLKKAS